jgi:hypothetical protein
MKEEQKACFFRFSSEIQDNKMLQGSWRRPTSNFDELQDMLNQEEYEDCELLQDPIA